MEPPLFSEGRWGCGETSQGASRSWQIRKTETDLRIGVLTADSGVSKAELLIEASQIRRAFITKRVLLLGKGPYRYPSHIYPLLFLIDCSCSGEPGGLSVEARTQ